MAFLDETGLTYLWKKIKRAPYPVGSIYISVSSTSPAKLFGGTWEQITGRFLLGAGPSGINSTADWGTISEGDVNCQPGETGGEALHTITQGEAPYYYIGSIPVAVPPDHGKWNTDNVKATTVGYASPDKPGIGNNGITITQGAQYGWAIGSGGGGGSHNNMPPYVAVYMWKRIA